MNRILGRNRSKESAPKYRQSNQKINAQPGNIHESRYERCRACGGIESQTAEDERQHASSQRSEHDDADQAYPYRKSQQQIMFAVVCQMEMLPQNNSKETDHSQQKSECQAGDEFSTEYREPIA